MAKKSNHVISTPTGWSVKKTGSYKASGIFDTQKKAEIYGIELSKKERTELYIHKENGQIRDRKSYVNDAKSSKG